MEERKPKRILTFNWHEPYLCMLAKTGHSFFVVEPELSPGSIRRWDDRMRNLPPNVRLLLEQEWKSDILRGEYDVVICQNVKDLVQVVPFGLPIVTVFHNKLTTELGLGGNTVDRNGYLDAVRALLTRSLAVFISESKKTDWGFPGFVIPPGVDPDEFDPYIGEVPKILRVGNLLSERDLMLGYSAQEKICAGFPFTVIGLNPNVPGSRLSARFDDLKRQYRTHRLFLNTTVWPYEDGYNLSMLEAMAVGMPVVTTENPVSPIEDGVNGYRSEDVETLKERIAHLLVHLEEARALGERGRETVRQKFPVSEFVRRWNEVLDLAVGEEPVQTGRGEIRVTEKPKEKRILFHYTYYPGTTGFYLDRALRERHRVVTAGSSLTPDIIEKWNLGNLKAEIRPQDIPCPHATDAGSIWARLPGGFQPDFYLFCETGISPVPPDIQNLPVPKACYLIDTHLNLEKHIGWAREFDWVFIAQREYIPEFNRAGLQNVHWLPLACDPEIHGKQERPKLWDIGFVGSITPAHKKRKELLDLLSSRFQVRVERCFLKEMARVFSESKIVFNTCIRNDLNMRVFEALASGSLLLTDEAKGSGLAEMFQDGRHLVLYTPENLLDRAEYYLQNHREREEIARRGMEEALGNHTYGHRVEEMIRIMERHPAKKERSGGALSLQPTGDSEPLNRYYRSVREDVISLVPERVEKILEVGCAAGYTGKKLKELRPRTVVGIEAVADAAREAEKNLDSVLCGDVEKMDALPFPEKHFDCILYADVLEHLKDPLQVLKNHRRYLSDSGSVIMSIPNVRFFGVVNGLMEGNWTYQDEGILDRTHLRFFTLKEMKALAKEAGFDVVSIQGKVSPVYEKIKTKNPDFIQIGRWKAEGMRPEEIQDFFVFQYLLTAVKTGRGVPGPESADLSVSHEMDGAEVNATSLAGLPTASPGHNGTEENERSWAKLVEDLTWEKPEEFIHLLANKEVWNRIVQRVAPDAEWDPGNWIRKIRSGAAPEDLEEIEARLIELKNAGRPDPEVHCLLGHLYMAEENFRAARDAYRNAVRMEPQNPTAYGYLGCSLYALGRRVEALRTWWKGYRISKTEPLVLRMIQRHFTDADHPERWSVLPLCRGKGIDVGCGHRKTDPGAIGVDHVAGGDLGKVGNVEGKISQADVCASGDDLPMFRDGDLDYVVSRHHLEHYVDVVKTLQEWKRVLKPGGVMGIVTPDETNCRTLPLDPTHFHAFTPESFARLVGLIGGFEILTCGEWLADWSLLCVLQKRSDSETIPRFDYHREFRALEAGQCVERVREYLERGNPKRAIQSALEALSLDPSGLEARCAFGDSLLADGRVSPALEEYRHVLSSDPEREGALKGHGKVCLKTGDFEKALELLSRAHRACPEDKELCRCLGEALLALERPQEGFAHFEQSLRLDPDDFASILGLFGGVDQLEHEDRKSEDSYFSRAVGHLNRFMTSHPAHLAGLLLWAKVKIELGLPTEAGACLDKVLLFDPENEEAAALLEMVLDRPGRRNGMEK